MRSDVRSRVKGDSSSPCILKIILLKKNQLIASVCLWSATFLESLTT